MTARSVSRTLAVLGLAALLAGPSARATLLPPGGTVAPSQDLTDPRTAPGETFLASMTGTFSGQFNQINGTYYDAVYRSAGGTLDFFYQVTNSNSLGGASIFTTSHSSFVGFTTDVQWYRTTPTDNIAATATRGLVGQTIVYDYQAAGGQTIDAGQQSSLEVIRTNATLFDTGLYGILGPDTVTVLAFEPTVATPEPSTIVSAVVGLLGLAGLIARRRRSA